jgi:MFS transporter, MHS family, proline/betaine transporter
MLRRGGRGSELLGVCAGNAVELYDFAVFGASATVLARVLTPGRGGLTSVFAVLAAALLVRPLGAVVLGRIADRTGRRTPFLATTVLMLGATTAVGLLPSGNSSGNAAGVVGALGLVLLRCLQAFSTGGETSTSVTYLYERALPACRGCTRASISGARPRAWRSGSARSSPSRLC